MMLIYDIQVSPSPSSSPTRGEEKNENGESCWDEDEILGFVMPWHTAQLIEKWAQFI
mgnify:CR=1 FL=1